MLRSIVSHRIPSPCGQNDGQKRLKTIPFRSFGEVLECTNARIVDRTDKTKGDTYVQRGILVSEVCDGLSQVVRPSVAVVRPGISSVTGRRSKWIEIVRN